jgi:hypothetical protein
MALFGYDMSDVSDEDIKAGIITMSRVINQLGVTAQEATEGLINLGQGKKCP